MPTHDPIKFRAYRKLRSAVESGTITRPDVCEQCGVSPARGKDGRSLIQAHHHAGYEDALNVVWLCTACHSAETPRAVGLANPNAKLSDDDILHILSSDETNPEIAARFGVDQRYAWEIRAGKYRSPLALIDKPATGDA